MIRKIFLIAAANFLIINIIAQSDFLNTENLNLVLNHSFEEFQDKIPCNFYFNYKEFNYAVTNWKTPNRGKPNVYNVLECEPDLFYSFTKTNYSYMEYSLAHHIANFMRLLRYNAELQNKIMFVLFLQHAIRAAIY